VLHPLFADVVAVRIHWRWACVLCERVARGSKVGAARLHAEFR